MSTLTVTNNNDHGSGSLRDKLASASSGDTIIFDESLAGATILLETELRPTVPVIVDCTDLSSPVIIDGGCDYNGEKVSPETLEGGGVRCINNTDAMATEWHGFIIQHGYSSTEACTGVWYGKMYDCEVRWCLGKLGGEYDTGAVTSVYAYNCKIHDCCAHCSPAGSGTWYDCDVYNNYANYMCGVGKPKCIRCHIHHNFGVYYGVTGNHTGTWKDCIIEYNKASYYTGAVSRITAVRCIFRYNECAVRGTGAVWNGNFYNCLIYGNLGDKGGAILSSTYSGFCTMKNCIVVKNYSYSNRSQETAVGLQSGFANNYDGYLTNCILSGEIDQTHTHYDHCALLTSSTLTNETELNNITIDDLKSIFVDPDNNNYLPLPEAITVDRGTPTTIIDDTDLLGNPRIQNGAIDIGCYEVSEDAIPTPNLTTSQLNSSTTVSVENQIAYPIEIQYTNDRTFTTTKFITTSTLPTTITEPFVYIRARYVDNGRTSMWSKVQQVSNIHGKSATISFSFPNYATGIKIQYSSNSDFQSYTEISSSTGSFVSLNLSGLIYFRAKYLGDNEHTLDSDWSQTYHAFFDSEAPVVCGVETESTLYITTGSSVSLISGITVTDNVDSGLQPYYYIYDEDGELLYDLNDNYTSIETASIPTGTYTIKYFAIDNSGNQSDFVVRQLRVIPTRLSRPTIAVATLGLSSIKLSGFSNANASGWEIDVDGEVGAVTPVNGCVIVAGLRAGSTHVFKARALGDLVTYGESLWSLGLTATTSNEVGAAIKAVETSTAKLKDITPQAGQIIVCSDTGKTYFVNQSNQRVPMFSTCWRVE